MVGAMHKKSSNTMYLKGKHNFRSCFIGINNLNCKQCNLNPLKFLN